MKIPLKYQVFDEKITITDKDAERLKQYLTGWNKLVQVLIAGVNKPDIQRLIILELMGKRRPQIIDKLLVRLGKIERERIEERIMIQGIGHWVKVRHA